jgi:hypothetical protein
VIPLARTHWLKRISRPPAISPDRDDDKVRPVRFAGWRVEAQLPTATANPNNFKYVARARLPVVGEALLASGWLLTIGLLNLFYAISVIAGSTIFITTAAWLVGDTRPEGWLMLVVALIQLAAAPGVLMGRLWALWIGLISVAGHVAAAIMFFADEPWIALGLLLIDATVFLCLLILARPARPATA